MDLYLITGTTKGLGAALAAQVAALEGAELVSLSRTREGPIDGGHAFEADLDDLAALQSACDRIQRHLDTRKFDEAVLINNAGVVNPVGPLDQADAGELARNLHVNLLAPMVLMGRFLSMTAHVALRRVINISSGAARRPIFGWGGYCSAKAGLDMASRVAALEAATRGQNVEIVSLAPGVIDTPMQGVVRSASTEQFTDVERFRAMKAEGVLRPPQDVAADILRLERAGRLRGEAVQDLREIQ